jgi:heme oxygenase
MDEAYRDKASAALARVDALERENRELRAKNDELERRMRAFEHASHRAPLRHSGSMVVGWLILTIGSILGAALFMANQLRHSPGSELHQWTPTPPLRAPAVPEPPVAPPAPSH